jgi:hypothetical protein
MILDFCDRRLRARELILKSSLATSAFTRSLVSWLMRWWSLMARETVEVDRFNSRAMSLMV